MYNSDIKINETHLCVLKKRGENLFVDYFELEFEFQNELLELEAMCNNSNRSSYELEEFAANSRLKILFQNFNYCNKLDGSFQGIGEYIITDYISYKQDIDEYEENLIKDEELSLEDKNEKIENYIGFKRNSAYHSIKNRIIPYLLDKAYKSLTNNNEVLAYSHRKIGWSFPVFKLSNDFHVIFKSNFGYGSSSYFFAIIRYKEIDIVPYSEWVHYRFVNQTDIIRYTRRYKLENESWRNTMDFTCQLYNSSVNKPFLFVNQWIVNECIEMVSGIENILNKNDEVIIKDNFFNNKQLKISGIDLINFKGEKISGALSFLNKMKELMILSNKIPELIERILNCNLSIYHDLNFEIIKLDKKIQELLTEKKIIQQNLFLLTPEVEKFNKLKEQTINDEKLKDPNFILTSEFVWKFEKEYELENSNFTEYKKIQMQFTILNDQLIKHEKYKKLFQNYVKTIENQFYKMERPLNNVNIA